MSIRIIRVNHDGGPCAVTGQECDELLVIRDDLADGATVQVSVNALVEMARRRARPAAAPAGENRSPPGEGRAGGAGQKSGLSA